MQKKIKLKQAILINDELNGLLKEPTTMLIKYKIKKAINSISSDIKSYNEQRNDFITNNGEKDKDGNPILKKDSDAYNKFTKQMSELLEADVNLVSELSMDDIKDIESDKPYFDLFEILTNVSDKKQ